MATFVILSRIAPGAIGRPEDFKQLADRVSEEIKTKCPGLSWKESYATMGRFDVVDIVETNTPAEATRAALILRGAGHEYTETLPATPWVDYLSNL